MCNSVAFLPANRHLKDLGVFVEKKTKHTKCSVMETTEGG